MLCLRVAPELKEQLAKIAKEDDRTLAQYVERLLLAHLKEKTSTNKAR
jgi:predicted DNA-binding protein